MRNATLKIIFIATFLLSIAGATAYAATPEVCPGNTSNDPLSCACEQSNQKDSPICKQATDQQNTCTNTNDPKEVKCTNPVITDLAKTSRVISEITGMIAVIMFVAGGIALITSGGNTDAVTNAKKRMTNAAIGVMISALAYTIISFGIQHFL